MDAELSIAIATWVMAIATCVYVGFTAIILAVLALAALFAGRQLLLMRRDSMRTIVKNLVEQWMSDTMVDARNRVEEVIAAEKRKADTTEEEAQLLKRGLNKLEKTGKETVRHLLRIPHYFEMVYVLIDSDNEAIRQVIRLYEETIIYNYEMYQPWITEKRQQLETEEPRTEGLYVEFEKLYKLALAAHEQGT